MVYLEYKKLRTKEKNMSAYQIRSIKKTATGKQYLLKKRDNSYAIATYVSADGNCISPIHTGQMQYIYNIWNKIQGKFQPVT